MANRVNRCTIYICTKLFNYNDKLQAEYLEEALLERLKYNIFMPFRDTDENNLKGPNRMKIVYDSDIERLNSGEVALLAVLYDGICKDEGISFEIGYAYGRGIPVFIINTDFIWYAQNEEEFLFDPIIAFMCSEHIHHYEIGQETAFKDALVNAQTKTFELAASRISDLLSNAYRPEPIQNLKRQYNLLIDFGGSKYEYQREYALWLSQKLKDHGISVAIANRYESNESIGLSQRGFNDIQRLLESDYYICLGDEVELNSGTAALLGLARCLGKRTILYESSTIEIHGENEHKMKKNLIIDFSIDRMAKTKEQIIEIMLEEIKRV